MAFLDNYQRKRSSLTISTNMILLLLLLSALVCMTKTSGSSSILGIPRPRPSMIITTGLPETVLVANDDDEVSTNSTTNSFDENYFVTWGNDHVFPRNRGNGILLTMDQHSGSGIASRFSYGSGYFHLRMKLPSRDTAGVCTTFYMTSHGDGHDELDFEFLGNREGKPIILQTNVFVNGEGNREQRLNLWFDPSEAFHTYKIMWNEHQIVFFVDDIPVRVFKNKSNVGGAYPSKAMRIEASLWDASDWATDGGKEKINWSYAPFQASFGGFDINDGCLSDSSKSSTDNDGIICYSDKLWWNRKKYWALNPQQQAEYETVRSKYMHYDYCTDRGRWPVTPLECY